MEQWVIEALEKIKSLYDKCDREDALREYTICIRRMLNGLAQIQCTEFHEYERLILSYPLEVFTSEFIEQVEKALTCENTQMKGRIIKDIEDSLYEIMNVYRNVVDNTAYSDRQMFMSKTVDTKMYDLSPKICAFYSEILKEIVDMFGQQSEKLYAFLLQPTMKSKIYTCQLFLMRRKSGKVIIVYTPENAIEEFDVLPIHLLHEAFHVLTKEERMRKERAINYLQNMLWGIYQLVFEQVNSGDDKLEEKVKKNLFELCLQDVTEIRDKISKEDENSRYLYSHELTGDVVKLLHQILFKIQDKIDDYVDECCCADSEDFDKYRQKREQALNIANQIKVNLVTMLGEGYLTYISDLYMRIYREVYADLACLLTLEVSPDIYQETFERAIHFRVRDQYSDFEKELRSLFVANAMTTYASGGVAEKWKHYADKLSEKIRVEDVKSSGHLNGRYVNILMNNQMETLFQTYFNECAGMIKKRLETVRNLTEFRQKMRKLMSTDQSHILPLVLSMGSSDLNNFAIEIEHSEESQKVEVQ